MPQSDAQRRAKLKYDAAHYTNISAKVSKQYAEKVKAVCSAIGTTPAAVIKSAFDKLLQDYTDDAPGSGSN